jgi:uncharacterized protein
MNRRTAFKRVAHLAAAPMLTALGLAGTGGAFAQSPPVRQKLVIQVSDGEPAKWNLALNNAKNVQDELGSANVDIEIVAYGPGISMLKLDSLAANRVQDAVKSGIGIVACENTMRNMKLAKDDMSAAISYAPAGVVQIMKRQQAGWTYLRP